MKSTLSTQAVDQDGQSVTVKGWVHSRRYHRGLIFIELRDHKGIVQLTIGEDSEQFSLAESLRDEFVIEATGTVTERDEELKNPNIPTGSIEIVVESMQLLNKSEALPLQVNSNQHVNEEHRLKYRYLDLRRDKMQFMLKKRAE